MKQSKWPALMLWCAATCVFAADPAPPPRVDPAPPTTPMPMPKIPAVPMPSAVPMPPITPLPTVPPMTPTRPDVLPLESVPIPTVEAEQPGVTLDELLFMAQTSHPALREASAKVGVAQGNAIQVGLPPNPFFFTSSPQWAGNVSQYNVVYCQDYITAGKLRLNRAAAEREVLQAQLQFTRTRYDVLTMVRVRFYSAAVAQRRGEVLRQLIEVTAQSRDVGKKLLEAGETNRADAMLLEIEYDKASVILGNNDAVSAAARKQLAAAVGVPEIDIGRLKFDLGVMLPEYEHEALRLGVVDRNAIAQAAAVEIQRTQLALRRARVEPYPNFQIQSGYQYSVADPYHNQGYGQFQMSIPLWNRNQGGIRAAQSDTARAVAGLQRTETELSQQAAAALGDYAAASARVEIYEKQILPKAREVFKVNRSLFEQGQTDFLRLLQSQRTLIDSDLGYLDAQEVRWTSAATISGLLQHEQFP